jgi:hypothetical protein
MLDLAAIMRTTRRALTLDEERNFLNQFPLRLNVHYENGNLPDDVMEHHGLPIDVDASGKEVFPASQVPRSQVTVSTPVRSQGPNSGKGKRQISKGDARDGAGVPAQQGLRGSLDESVAESFAARRRVVAGASYTRAFCEANGTPTESILPGSKGKAKSWVAKQGPG